MNGTLIYLPETVNTDRLTALGMLNQTIEVRGIISTFQGSKRRYRFTTDDGAAITVVGDFPSQGGVTYYLRARVIQEGNNFVLAETDKSVDPFDSDKKKDGFLDGANAPLVLGGGALLLVALVAMGVMMSQNKAAGRERAFQEQLRQERERGEEERKRLEAQARSAAPNNNGANRAATVAISNNNKNSRQNTVASRGTVRVSNGPHAGEHFPLLEGETRIGRTDADNVSVVLDKDKAVSGWHASVFVTRDNRLVFEDRSSNGSTVDGAFVHRGKRDISSGSTIEMGASALKVEVFAPMGNTPSASGATPNAPFSPGTAPNAPFVPGPGAGVAPNAPASPDPASGANSKRNAPTVQVATSQVQNAVPGQNRPPKTVQDPGLTPQDPTLVGYGAEFEVLQGPEAGRRFPITRAVTSIGREGCDILLQHPSVSRKHATLSMRNGQFFVADNKSAHGTRIGNAPLDGDEKLLSNGDEISFGTGTTVLFRSL